MPTASSGQLRLRGQKIFQILLSTQICFKASLYYIKVLARRGFITQHKFLERVLILDVETVVEADGLMVMSFRMQGT